MQLEEFGPFVLVRPLGKGGMGVVYLAKTNIEGHPLAAIKRLRPDVAKLQGFAERFWHESELAKRLRHPRIVETLDVGEVDGKPYVASTFVVGKSVAAICDRLSETSSGASAAVVIGVLAEALSALAYIHEARDERGRPLQLVHRDITPGNLLIGYDGKTRLADFGLAKSFLTEHLMLTGEGMILGTPKYLPPEVVRGEKATRAADIYGLAAVAYRLLAGVAPYEGDVRTVIQETLRGPPRRLRELRPDVPEWLATFVEKMMARDPAQRPADAEQLHKQLTQLARTNRVQLTYEQMGAWLRELFREEAPEEIAEAEALEKHELPSRADETHVLAPKNSDNRHTAVLGEFGQDVPTEMQSIPKLTVRAPAPYSPAGPLIPPPQTMSIEPQTLTPADLVAIRSAPAAGSIPPLVQPVIERRGVSARMIFAMGLVVAVAAGVGVVGGSMMTRGGSSAESEARKWELVDRIEVSKRSLATRRAAGQKITPAMEKLSAQITEAVRTDRWPEARVLLVELEDALSETSTVTGR